jgi:NAD(P)-dependent dehydrogenase (short-subunit alcohol dehydrogenase family)/uncharacterized OB-fold protein
MASPLLPPRNRGPLASRLVSLAALGRFELPACKSCGTIQYPLREICRNCLSDDLAWRTLEPTGVLLARTRLHHSTEPYFLARVPFEIGSVKLDGGPVALAFLSSRCGPALARVRLHIALDRAGEAVLVAAPEKDLGRENIMSDPNREIEGKVVLITGAAGGIGAALVDAFLAAGAGEVIAAGRRPPQSDDRRVSFLPLDLAEMSSVESLADKVADRVEILVNNAGVNTNRPALAAESEAGARDEMSVNYFGLLHMLRAFSPAMRRRCSGTIVNVLSVLSHVNLPVMGSYAASKAAAWSLTQAARAELAHDGVRVCAIFPRSVDTAMTAGSSAPKSSPTVVAKAMVDMIRDGIEDRYEGLEIEELYTALREDPKAVERRMAAVLHRTR